MDILLNLYEYWLDNQIQLDAGLGNGDGTDDDGDDDEFSGGTDPE